MKRLICILCPLAAASLGAAAQQGEGAEGGLDRRVEVTKAYVPQVEAADKLSPTPRMEDTVALRPRITYSIPPAAWQSTFAVEPIPAAGIDARPGTLQPRLYVEAGAGWPLRSTADVYYNGGERTRWGFYANHRGEYADLRNDFGQKLPATWSTNRAGLHAEVPAWARVKLAARADYDWNYHTRYGLTVPVDGAAGIAGYSSPHGQIALGNDFTDLTRLNFSVGVRGGHFADRRENFQSRYGLFAAIAKGFGRSTFGLRAEADVWKGGGEALDGYSDRIARVIPEYGVQTDRFRLRAGIDVTFAENCGVSQTALFPRLSVNWDVASGYFVPFVEITGAMSDNGMESLARRNPFMAPGSAATVNTSRHDLYGGVSGSLSPSFAYKLYGGASIHRSRVAMVYLSDQGGMFEAMAQDAVQVSLGGEASWRVARGLSLSADLRWSAFPENTASVKVADIPQLEFGGGVHYSWRALKVDAGVDILGYRYFYGKHGGMAVVTTAQDPVADVHLAAQYDFGQHWGVFIRARNLLDAKLYPWHHYRGAGINALGGVKLSF